MTPPPALWLVRADTPVAPTTLDAGERRRARAFAQDAVRDRYVAGHAALRRLLAARLGVPPRQVALTREPCPVCGGPHGRPTVAGGTPPYFSLAYSGGLCLIALADTPVGVDMERIPPSDVVSGLAADLHPVERAELAGLPEDERPRAFARAWVRKEAYLKGLGTGLALGLSAAYVGTGMAPAECLEGWAIADVAVDSGRVAAIAARHW
ncbi:MULTISPECIES: 4'-phosphopantetheinyl transferase family protein [unclassified Streptomyces]|uniref:4'-phosphopantetheinyl transferase family protein n=1 Tax=unclassified Streptomyces TaxID=2593676 RepID=UPI0035E15C85